MTVFDRIQELAKKRDKSLQDIATDLDFSKNLFYRWKTSEPKAIDLSKVADYFGVTTDYLLGRTNDPFISQKHEEFAEGIYPIFMDATNEELELFNEIMLLSNKEKHILRDLVDMFSELKKANSK